MTLDERKWYLLKKGYSLPMIQQAMKADPTLEATVARLDGGSPQNRSATIPNAK